MLDYQYRYTQKIDDKVISQSQYLLQISEAKGDVFDNVLNTNVKRIGEILLEKAQKTTMICTIEIRGATCEIKQGQGKQYQISEILALVESAQNKQPVTIVKFSGMPKYGYFISFCLPESIKVEL
jgi:hypothetical protein